LDINLSSLNGEIGTIWHHHHRQRCH